MHANKSVANALVGAFVLGSLAACSSQTGATQTDAGGERSSACVAQDTALQDGLDGARSTSPNSILAVHNAGCGTSVYVNGSSETATAASLWRIASVTKTFVSATVLSLVRDGKVALDDPLSKWVPDVPNTDGVTVEMLLDHRSGIFNYSEDSKFDGSKPWTPEQIVQLATGATDGTQHEPYFAPDAGFHYSNTNYLLLGMVIEAVTGKKAGAVLHERAIDKARLRATFFDDGSDVVAAERMARGFATDGTDVTFFNAPHLEGWTVAAIVATAGDVADWVATLYGSDTILDGAGRALLSSRTSSMGIGWPLALSNGALYGLGVELADPSMTGAGPAMGHAGEMSGFKSYAFYFPEEDTSIVAMVNSDAYSEAAHLNAIFSMASRVLFGGLTTDAGR